MMDISAILTAHREGTMAGMTLRSFLDAADWACREGLEVELLVMLDDPDITTKTVFADIDTQANVHHVAFGDQGLVRNHAVGLSRGEYIAFLDGDDLWSENWLVAAHETCIQEPGRIVAHPVVDWFFDQNNNLFFHADQTDPEFSPAHLRIANFWDALCMAPRQAYLEHPFGVRAVTEGFAYEDWHWNCETLVAGYVHQVAPDTIHFKRRRKESQTTRAASSRCLPRDSDLFDYQWLADKGIG